MLLREHASYQKFTIDIMRIERGHRETEIFELKEKLEVSNTQLTEFKHQINII